jgi:hypothetical protein
MARQTAQQGAQIRNSAFAKILQQRAQLVTRQCRCRIEPRVIPILTGQDSEHAAAFARDCRKPLHPVSPPIETAEETDHNDLSVLTDAIDPQIDRHRVPQITQMRQAQARQRRALRCPCRGKAGKIAVGEGQDRNFAWRLAEIDRFDDFVEAGRTRREQMHRSPLGRSGAKRGRHCGAVEAF